MEAKRTEKQQHNMLHYFFTNRDWEETALMTGANPEEKNEGGCATRSTAKL